MPNVQFLLSHGIYGEGPINSFLISDNFDKLIAHVKTVIPADRIAEVFCFGTDGTYSIRLTKDFNYSGFSYNMFFIRPIETI